ncbi:MAG: hypothetical protein V4736_08220 [Bdellovibrionota bacterium]
MTIFCLFFLMLSHIPVILLFFIGVLIVFLSYLPHFLHRMREEKFLERIPYHLEMMILAMKTGHSLRNSLRLQIESSDSLEIPILKSLLAEIELTSGPGHQHSPFLKTFFSEIKIVSTQKSKIVESLKAVHHHYHTVVFFRHRSRQSTMQIRVQSALLSLFFVPTIAYHMFSDPMKHIFLLISGSILFIFGIFTSLYLGKMNKWKT